MEQQQAQMQQAAQAMQQQAAMMAGKLATKNCSRD